MKIKMLHPGVTYDRGAILDFPEDLARRLIRKKKAEPAPDGETTEGTETTEETADSLATPAIAEDLVPQPHLQEHMTPKGARRRGPWK